VRENSGNSSGGGGAPPQVTLGKLTAFPGPSMLCVEFRYFIPNHNSWLGFFFIFQASFCVHWGLSNGSPD